MTTTGDRIRSIRRKRKKTLQEVGEAIGATATTVSKYESGSITNIPTKKINAIAEFLEISPAYLLGYDYDDQPLILTISEQLMMEDYRKLTDHDKETVCILIKRLYDVRQEESEPLTQPVQLTL